MQLVQRKNFASKVIGIIIALFAFAVICVAQETPQKAALVKIKNFGQMDDRFYRGAQPKETDYKDLATLGIKTVIDLTEDPKPYEKTTVESLGMRYINIPMVDKSYPSMDQINQFLKVVDDPATGKFFVHCAGGRHRTGVVGAVYRFTHDHWNLDQVLAEMDQYEFGSGYGHGKQMDFVKNYWQNLSHR